MRKALIVGIDHYSHIQALTGCVNDAHAVKNVLERHADGTINFANPRLMTATGGSNTIVKGDLKDAVRELFDGDMDIALFYFAGHGYIEDTGGYLCTTECKRGDDGLTLAEVMALASGSKATNMGRAWRRSFKA
jgi:uncharacterized caspase-like protein